MVGKPLPQCKVVHHTDIYSFIQSFLNDPNVQGFLPGDEQTKLAKRALDDKKYADIYFNIK